MNKIIKIFSLFLIIILLQGCSIDKNKIDTNTKNIQNENTETKEKNKIDHIKEFDKNKIDQKCKKYENRIYSEIEEYKKRISNIDGYKEETFNLIGVFYSNKLEKCFYVLENSYTHKNNKTIDYIINNAELEETIDIFNNIDYNFLNERIEELQK